MNSILRKVQLWSEEPLKEPDNWKKPIKKRNNLRKSLYIIFVPLVIIEWIVDMIKKLFEVIQKSFETLALSLEKYINEPTGKPPAN